MNNENIIKYKGYEIKTNTIPGIGGTPQDGISSHENHTGYKIYYNDVIIDEFSKTIDEAKAKAEQHIVNNNTSANCNIIIYDGSIDSEIEFKLKSIEKEVVDLLPDTRRPIWTKTNSGIELKVQGKEESESLVKINTSEIVEMPNKKLISIIENQLTGENNG